MTTEVETPQKKPVDVSWAHVSERFVRGRFPRVRLFMFSVAKQVTIIPDKYGPGKDQYSFPIKELEEVVFDGKRSWVEYPMETEIRTASKSVVEQIQKELKEYLPTRLFSRTYILTREGDGMKTRYVLKGYESTTDAKAAYESIMSYLREVGE